MEIIKSYGYAVEIHNVITEDGYILELHRLPKSKNGDKFKRHHPVFYHHAFLSSSAESIIGGPNTSICEGVFYENFTTTLRYLLIFCSLSIILVAMQLVDDGYDVWLANCRGSTYSRKHVSMTSKKKDFWNFR